MTKTRNLAILAGEGRLPGEVAAAAAQAGHSVHLVEFAGVALRSDGGFPVIGARFEALGALFADLRAVGVGSVVLAGALRRPVLDPAAFDAATRAVLPRIMAALSAGDDTLLRTVMTIFEAEGFAVLGAHELAPGLLVEPGVLTRAAPSDDDLADIARATEIVAALGRLDLGQAVVVAQGQCLGVETAQGTDALLDWVAASAPAMRGTTLRARGVLVKCPKPGQDLRADMPVIGPGTMRRVAAAGLAGVALTAGGALVLAREETLAEAERSGLFLIASKVGPP